jgi:hypothetical protein
MSKNVIKFPTLGRDERDLLANVRKTAALAETSIDADFANLIVALAHHAPEMVKRKILNGFGDLLQLVHLEQERGNLKSLTIWSKLGFMTGVPALDENKNETDLTIL